jgi:hypothetical protein
MEKFEAALKYVKGALQKYPLNAEEYKLACKKAFIASLERGSPSLSVEEIASQAHILFANGLCPNPLAIAIQRLKSENNPNDPRVEKLYLLFRESEEMKSMNDRPHLFYPFISNIETYSALMVCAL